MWITRIVPKVTIGVLLLILVAVFAGYKAYGAEPITIGIKESPPFVIKGDGDNKWTGTSIDVTEAVAAELQRPIKYIEYKSISALLSAVETNKVDMAVSALSITAERERVLDFSYPYSSTMIGVLTKAETPFIDIALKIGGKVVGTIIGLVGLLYFIGWLVDRVDGDGTLHNPHEGAWWALVTFSTTGYGDVVPETPRGKVFAGVWIIISLFLCSLFTGYVSSSMTVTRLSNTPTTLSDLHRNIVVTIKDTTSEQFLITADVQHFTVDSLAEALSAFRQQKVDAVVYDEILLSYYNKDSDNSNIWPLNKHAEFYGVALPDDSPLKEVVDISILRNSQH